MEYEGIGIIGLLPDDFWRLTYREFAMKWRGYYERIEAWERVVRLQTYYTISPHVKDKIEPFDLWTLPSEYRNKLERYAQDSEKAERLFVKSLTT